MTIQTAIEDDASVAARLVATAEAMIPALRERTVSTEENRGLLKETVDEIRRAQLARVMMPKRWGGFELSPQAHADIAIALGRGEISTAWVYVLYCTHNYHLGFFDDRAQEEVWGENPDAFIASSYAPGGRAEPVAGGYKLNGRWKYSSGSNDSDWVILGAIATDRPQDGLSFLLPRADYKVLDTWNTFGLKGTGSNDVLVEDVFVPSHRTYAFAEGFAGKHPGTNQGALYKIPFLQVFLRAISYASIGALQTMHEDFIKYGISKSGAFGDKMVTDPDAQYAAALGYNHLHEIKTLLRVDLARLMEVARSGELPSMEERLGLRYRAAHVAERCVEAARMMLEASGGGSLFETLPFGRTYRNLTAARQHFGVQHRPFARALGGQLFGIESGDIRV